MMIPLVYRIAAALGLVAMTFGYGYYSGKGACETKQLKQTIKTVEKVRYVRQKTDAMPSGAVYDGLRKWQR